jgi:glycosyltransferase involved in cell wall biosynthesis
MKLSIIIPCRNESASVPVLIKNIRHSYPEAEIILVNDGSDDNSGELAADAGATVLNHPYSLGNGAAIKNGARAATGDILVFMDADAQHDPAYIPQLLQHMADGGYDMVVGARTESSSQASTARWAANSFYNRLASWMVGHRVADLTSGFRAVKADKFKEFLYLLPNGFSYPTTITMAFFRAGYLVSYCPIKVYKRQGKSHIRPLRDGMRFLLIIFKIGSLYAPLKLFGPLSAFTFTIGLSYYLYTYLSSARFTNMSALLFTTSLLIFLIGLVSEQITQLLYMKKSD